MSIWHEYVSIITDPAHTLVETTFIAAEFVLFSVIAVRLKKAWYKALDLWHRRLDEEHGVEHVKSDKEIIDSITSRRKKERLPSE
jgi:ABC-type taurine transport system ATPase subunit